MNQKVIMSLFFLFSLNISFSNEKLNIVYEMKKTKVYQGEYLEVNLTSFLENNERKSVKSKLIDDIEIKFTLEGPEDYTLKSVGGFLWNQKEEKTIYYLNTISVPPGKYKSRLLYYFKDESSNRRAVPNKHHGDFTQELEILNSNEGESKIVYSKLLHCLNFKDFKQATLFSDELIKKSLEFKNQKFLANALHAKKECSIAMGDYKEAIKYVFLILMGAENPSLGNKNAIRYLCRNLTKEEFVEAYDDAENDFNKYFSTDLIPKDLQQALDNIYNYYSASPDVGSVFANYQLLTVMPNIKDRESNFKNEQKEKYLDTKTGEIIDLNDFPESVRGRILKNKRYTKI